MTLTNTVDAPSPYAWDWSDTTHESAGSGLTVSELAAKLAATLGGAIVTPTGKGLHSWNDSLDVFDCDGYRLGRVYYSRGKEPHIAPMRSDVFVRATGSAADLVRSELVNLSERAPKSARVDTRVDTLAGWDDLAGVIHDAASMYGTRTTLYSSESGIGDARSSSGRTLYMGSPTSWIRVRLYEKWLESPGQYVEGTNRLEVQLRPPSRKKGDVSGWSRAETFCASRVTRELATQLGTELAEPGTLQLQRGTPDLEQTLEAAGQQYGKAFARFLELSGGDVDRLLHYLTVKVPSP